MIDNRISARVYDEHVAKQGLEHQVAMYYEPVDVSMQRRLAIIMPLVDARPGQRILDAGCGVGTFAFHCARQGADAAGVDYSQESLAVARVLTQRYAMDQRTQFIAADVTALPFLSQSFDTIVSIDFIEHIGDADKEVFLQELHRVLVPGGKAIIFTPNGIREQIGAVYWHLRHRLWGHTAPDNPLHFGLITRLRFQRMLAACGFTWVFSYHDVTRPYIAAIPLVRRMLALNLLWVIQKK